MRVMLDVDADLAGGALELDSCHPPRLVYSKNLSL
jgi:hypothetical protein